MMIHKDNTMIIHNDNTMMSHEEIQSFLRTSAPSQIRFNDIDICSFVNK